MHDEFEEAKTALDIAWRKFEVADGDHVDAAIYEIQAAQERFDQIIRSKKCEWMPA